MSKPLKYLGYTIVFQEVPNEVTLAINISGCQYHCKECHSQYLWEYNGNYIFDDIDNLLDKYDNLITCVCFMGGDQNQEELVELLKKIKVKKLKTALYTGCDNMNLLDFEMINNLNYIKIGHYDCELGGLSNRTTNQRFYKKNEITNDWEDITSIFWKK